MNCKFKSAIAIFMIALSFNSTTFAGTNNMGNGSDYEFYIDVVGKKVWTQGIQLKHVKLITGRTLLQIVSLIFIQLLKKFHPATPQHT